MQKNYLYLMVCVIGAMSLASCSEDSISPDAGGDGDGDSTTEVPLAQVAKPKPNPWLAQEEYTRCRVCTLEYKGEKVGE